MGLKPWVVLIFAVVTGVRSWVNNYGEEFRFECPAGQHLSRIKTSYSSEHQDHLFDLQCAQSPSGRPPIKCVWQGQWNAPKTRMDFRCGKDRYFAGMLSHYKTDEKDRTFAFYCCNIPFNGGKYSKTICSWSRRPDDDYTVPNGYMMIIADSDYASPSGPRTFAYKACKIQYAG